jgi:hypothetical protein
MVAVHNSHCAATLCRGLLAGYRSEDVRADVRLRVVLANGSKAEELIGKVSTHACMLSARHHAPVEAIVQSARIKHVHTSRAWITPQHRNLIFELQSRPSFSVRHTLDSHWLVRACTECISARQQPACRPSAVGRSNQLELRAPVDVSSHGGVVHTSLRARCHCHALFHRIGC